MDKEKILVSLTKLFEESVENSSKAVTKINTKYEPDIPTNLRYPSWINKLDHYHYARERNPAVAYKNGPWIIGINIQECKDKIDQKPYFETQIFGLRNVEDIGYLTLNKNNENLNVKIIKNNSNKNYAILDAWIEKMRLKANEKNLVFSILKNNHYEPVFGFEICKGEYWHAKGKKNCKHLIKSLLKSELKDYTYRICDLIKNS